MPTALAALVCWSVPCCCWTAQARSCCLLLWLAALYDESPCCCTLPGSIVSSTGALSLDAVPKSLVVIGGGYIGLELGSG